jgi:hypothetical protein
MLGPGVPRTLEPRGSGGSELADEVSGRGVTLLGGLRQCSLDQRVEREGRTGA